jgi:hypothetical protein
MPRVNRDLQRRMAARRERERRRPTGERRYRFATPEPALEADEALLEGTDVEDVETEEAAPAPARGRRSTTVAPTASIAAGRGTRAAPKPFSAYKEEYTYVYGDLRRVGFVIGSLLAALIVLYFVLPLLVRF